MSHDPINNPSHYTSHPSGAECIEIAEWFSFNLGNVIKYVWRAGRKGDRLEDLRKARWYLDREIVRLEQETNSLKTAVANNDPFADPNKEIMDLSIDFMKGFCNG